MRKVNAMSRKMTSGSQMASDALTHLATQVEKLPEPYLITGPQAAYVYHRWLQPISKMIEICIPPEKVMTWQAILSSSWTVLSQPPTVTRMRRASRILILKPHWTQKQNKRRVMYKGLAFISAEDLCIDLLRESKTQIGLSEIAALLIKQKDNLDWSYLFHETKSSWLGYRLKEIIQTINHEAGYCLIDILNFERLITLYPNITAPRLAIRPNSVADILRPLRIQWELTNAQPA